MKQLLTLILALLIAFPAYGADSTISGFPDLGEKPATDDEFLLWDSSTGTTKKVDFSEMSDINNVDIYGGLTAAVASLGSTEITVLVDTAQTVTDNLSIPTTMALVVLRDGDISVSAGKILTINGHILAGAYQIFSGTGTVTNNSASIIYGAWSSGGSGGTLGGTSIVGQGQIVQVKTTTYATQQDTTSVSQQDSNLNITFDSAILSTSNDVEIIFNGDLRVLVGGAKDDIFGFVSLWRDDVGTGTLLVERRVSQKVTGAGAHSVDVPVTISLIDSPSVTSAQKYSIGFRSDGTASTSIHFGNIKSTLTIKEIGDI